MNLSPTTREEVQDAWVGGQRSPNTKDAYRRDTDQFFAWCDGHGYDVLGLTRVEADRYRGWLGHHRRRGGPLADSTIARKLTALSSFYAYIVDDLELMGRSPIARVKRPEPAAESTTAGLDLAESRRFLDAARSAGPMEHALIQLMLTTALRVSEACVIRTDDVYVDRGHHVLKVRRKGGKRGRLPIPADTWATIDAYLGGRTGPVFLSARVPLYRQEAYRIVRRLAAAAGIPDKWVTPHSLRHTAITLLLDGDADRGIAPLPLRRVQQLAGHRDPKTTMGYDLARGAIDDSAAHVLAGLLAAPTTEEAIL